MPKPVAVDGDTQFETSSAKHEADTNNAGQWSLVSSSVTLGSKTQVDGAFVELEATASWTYTGGTATTGTSTTSVGPFSDEATLRDGPTKLTDGGNHLLVDGDKVTGTTDSGNKIVVSVSQTQLKTD